MKTSYKDFLEEMTGLAVIPSKARSRLHDAEIFVQEQPDRAA
jgi:hypothetical protein